MREIKFRAWDFVNKIMDEDVFIDGAGNAYDYASMTYNTPNTEIQRCEFPVMQYTGLKDKYGVEIYEGDIVQAFSQGVKGNFEVKWRQEGSPGWVLFPAWQSSQMWHLHAIETEKGKYQDSVTVIGNRFENPELLKEEPTC